MIADLDTLLIALYVELTDRVIPTLGIRRRGPGRPPQVTDAELVCLAVAQVLLRYNDERHWLRAAPTRVGHLFPRLLGQSEYNHRLKAVSPLMEAALRWLADHTPASAELLRLLDGTPVGCGQSRTTAKRSGLFGYAGYGYEPSHSRYYWGSSSCCSVPPTGRSPDSAWPTPSCGANAKQSASCWSTSLPTARPLAALWSATRACRGSRPRSCSLAWICSWSARPAPTNTGRDPSPTGCVSGWRRSSGH